MQKGILVVSVIVNLFFVVLLGILVPKRDGISYLTYMIKEKVFSKFFPKKVMK